MVVLIDTMELGVWYNRVKVCQYHVRKCEAIKFSPLHMSDDFGYLWICL